MWVDAGPWQGWRCIGCSLAIDSDGTELYQGPYGVAADMIHLQEVQLRHGLAGAHNGPLFCRLNVGVRTTKNMLCCWRRKIDETGSDSNGVCYSNGTVKGIDMNMTILAKVDQR